MKPLDIIMRHLTPRWKITPPPVADPNWRTFLRFRHARTPGEQSAFRAAFQVPGAALESQPQFRAVALLAESLDAESDHRMVGHHLTAEQLREEIGFRRALRTVLDTLRKEWDDAHAERETESAPKA
jgi:hypothetical protein